MAIDSELVQKLWEESIENDVVIDDPYFATSNADYQRRVDAAKEAIGNAKKKSTSNYSFERGPFRAAPYTEQKVLDALFRFEARMANASHSVCANCRECSLNIVTSVRASLCTKCRDKKRRTAYNDENSMLPAWIDDEGDRHYEIPKELSELTIAEKLLIQRVSPLVPIVHIKNGTLGIKGHVCSFLQDVNEVATKLPRLPTNVKAIKMVRTYAGSDGKETTKTYMVNRKRVMTALHWLVLHHCDYKRAHADGELAIDEANLNWMGDQEEAELPSVAAMTRTFDTPTDADGTSVPSVSDVHGLSPSNTGTDELESSGITCQADACLTNEATDALLQSLKESAKDAKVSVLDWPQTTTEALSEFSDAVKIFTNAFPHLYPGGIGDANDHTRVTQIDAADWAKHLLLYDDGRFERDPLWPFFAFNFIRRRQNVQSGSFFVKTHISNPPKSLDELKKQLEDGNSSFVNKLMFYSKRISGSTAYWRYMRSRLYTWINYHVAQGHGPPNVFMTLSCAEYFWPDMIRLLEERVWIAEGRHRNGPGAKVDRNGDAIDLTTDTKARNKAVNDYAAVVQEFFINRTEDYLKTVGKDVLGIQYYWCRFEFAKGRGQIHAHLLAILKKEMIGALQRQLNEKNGSPQEEALLVADWARDTFGMSAELER